VEPLEKTVDDDATFATGEPEEEPTLALERPRQLERALRLRVVTHQRRQHHREAPHGA